MISTRRTSIRVKTEHKVIVVANLHADHKEISITATGVVFVEMVQNYKSNSIFFIDTGKRT